MKQTQHCVVSVFSWVDKNEYRFRQFFVNCNLDGKIIQFCKKRRKNAKKIYRKGDCSFEKNMV